MNEIDSLVGDLDTLGIQDEIDITELIIREVAPTSKLGITCKYNTKLEYEALKYWNYCNPNKRIKKVNGRIETNWSSNLTGCYDKEIEEERVNPSKRRSAYRIRITFHDKSYLDFNTIQDPHFDDYFDYMKDELSFDIYDWREKFDNTVINRRNVCSAILVMFEYELYKKYG